MKLTEYAPFILGHEYLGTLKKEPYRGSEDMLKRGKMLLQIHETARGNLEKLDSSLIFYKAEADFAQKVPTDEREEMFYSLKIGYTSPVIPAKALFLLKKCYDTYGTVSLFPSVITKTFSKKILSKGYIQEGYNLRDIICSTLNENYEPISDNKYAVPNGDFWDTYIPSTDTVAIIPNKLKEVFTSEDLRNFTIENDDICLHGKPIRELGGYVGVVSSVYDLRELV